MDFSRVKSYYAEFLGHADDARRVAWRCSYGQEVRFEELLGAIEPTELTGRSVLDVGCGLGDLFSYLRKRGNQVDYTGVDIVPEMVAAARERHPEGRFDVRDILSSPIDKTFDIVICSGALTVRVPDHDLFVQKMLAQMLKLARLAVSVNFQSTRAFRSNPMALQNDDLYYADPLKLYAFCRSLCPWTVLREDTLASDFCIHMLPGHAPSVSRYSLIPSRPKAEGVGWLLLERRLPLQALKTLEAAPRTAETFNLIGMAQHQLGHWAEAASHYREALRLDPGFDAARLNLETVSRRLET